MTEAAEVLTLSLMGEPRLRRPDGSDATPRNRKIRALFALLARTPGQRLGRERIVGLLWSDRGEEQARASLRQALADLARTAPLAARCLEASRLDVALRPGAIATDLDHYTSALAAGHLAEAARHLASASSAGPLAGIDGLSPGLDDWLVEERQRIEADVVREATHTVGRAADDALQPARALLTALERLSDVAEDAVQMGMRLDARAGDMAGVHRRYRALEARLKRDYDASPSHATRELLGELTSAAPVIVPLDGGAGTSAGEPPTVVITPLAVLDGDARADALVRVLGHDFEAALNRLPDVRVLALSQPTPERLARAQAGSIAAYVLGGSVRPAPGGWRLSLSLQDLGEGRIVWSHRVEASEAGLAHAIDEAVERVAGALLPSVERDILSSRQLETAGPAAYALYLRGRAGLLSATTLAEAEAAAALLEEALRRDPSAVNPRLHLVLAYNTDFMQKIAGHDPQPWRVRAMRLAQEAVQLDPDSADARARLGWCYLRTGDAQRADQHLREALAMGPLHADNVEQCGFGLWHLGHAAEALGIIQRAFVLNPFPRSDYFADIGAAQWALGALDEAQAQFALADDDALHYRGLQLACLGEMGHRETAERRDALRAQHATIWARAEPPDDSDLVATLFTCMPILDPALAARLRSGLQAAGIDAAASRR